MPASHRSLDDTTVHQVVDAHLHAPVPTDALGIELEWLTSDPADRRRRPSLAELDAIVADAGDLPGGSRVTIEPGGQLELVTAPTSSIDTLCEVAADGLLRVEGAARRAGLELVALGTDPSRTPARVTDAARYVAMEDHFDRRGPDGRTMMCNTASIQLNVGRGDGPEVGRRWKLANDLGPVLIAAFAGSPLGPEGETGWRSTRLRTWWRIDPGRTAPVPTTGDVTDDWTTYALDASVMLIRRSAADHVALDGTLSFRSWVAHGHETGWPTEDDLAYHLTTLFPPVRPRGWLELRMFDALPTPFWHVAAAVTVALLDEQVSRDVAEAIAGTEALWVEASRIGLDHPALRAAAARCFTIARAALASSSTDGGIQAVVATYDDRWVQRGRCPADDVLDRWRATGDPYPPMASPVPFHELEASVS